MTMDFLRTSVHPPLSAATLKAMEEAVTKNSIPLPVLGDLGADGIAAACKVADTLECARVARAISVSPMAPPSSSGGPVKIYVKMGFQDISCIDTVTQSLNARFFLDLYYYDPRLVGAAFVPESTWRPLGIYLHNQVGDLTCHYPQPKPSFVNVDADGRSKDGKLMWPSLYHGTLRNPMDLRDFPFDRDHIQFHVHQAETASSHECAPEPATASRSLRWLALARHDAGSLRWRALRWSCGKVVLPLFICTVFCFVVFALGTQDLSGRIGLSLTLFLATSALLYVIAGTVPKTAYLTAIDKLVVCVLTIQFLVAGISVTTYFIATDADDAKAARLFDGCTGVALLVTFLVAFTHFFFLRFYSYARSDPRAWPRTLLKVPGVEYHCFADSDGVNIFPPPPAGPPPAWALAKADDQTPLLAGDGPNVITC